MLRKLSSSKPAAAPSSPAARIRRAPKRGSNPPNEIPYPEDTSTNPDSFRRRSRAIAGSATVMTVMAAISVT